MFLLVSNNRLDYFLKYQFPHSVFKIEPIYVRSLIDLKVEISSFPFSWSLIQLFFEIFFIHYFIAVELAIITLVIELFHILRKRSWLLLLLLWFIFFIYCLFLDVRSNSRRRLSCKSFGHSWSFWVLFVSLHIKINKLDLIINKDNRDWFVIQQHVLFFCSSFLPWEVLLILVAWVSKNGYSIQGTLSCSLRLGDCDSWLDFPSHHEEGLFNILAILGRGFQKPNIIVFS